MREMVEKHRRSDTNREEKQARMQEKRSEMQARREVHRAVVEKLLA